MKIIVQFSCVLLAVLLSSTCQSQDVQIVRNKKGTKSWLQDSEGKRISEKYASISNLYGAENLQTDRPTYFQFSSKKGYDAKVGLLNGKGEIVLPDTIVGHLTLLNEDRFSAEDIDEHHTIYTFDGKLDQSYSENLYYYADGVLIKQKDGLYAAFSIYNEQYTDYIYSEFDTGYFLDRDPPVLVYMVKPDGTVDRISPDGTIIK